MCAIPPDGAPSSYRFAEAPFREFLRARGLRAEELAPERLEELHLASGCAAGDEAAWEAFFRAYRPFLYHVARQLAGQAADAEDLASQVLEGLMAGKMARYSGRGSFRGWLRAVTVHLFLDGRRRVRNKRWETLDDQAEQPAAEAAPENGCEQYFQPDFLDELADGLAGALRALPHAKAAFLNMYYFQGLTLAEAASELAVHESTASRWNAAIVEELKRRMDRFLRREKGWTALDVADFMGRCLGYLAGRLEKLRRSLLPG
jgi:RNA polymerase sigma factor (sigma-70 family)